jgi:predicted dienelactone hydrolase
MKIYTSVFCLLLLLSEPVFASSVGFKQIQLGNNSSRPLHVTLWYPTLQTGPTVLVADNRAFFGNKVVKEAAVAKTTHPVLLISHGYRGNWRNLSWLAYQFAQRGFIVAAPDHPGTTTFNHSPEQASQWWQRPYDLTRVLDYLLQHSDWQPLIDQENISAVGHSLGGWSVMQLAGAQFSRTRFLEQCRRYPNPRTCGLAQELGLSEPQVGEPAPADLRDTRIKSAVTLDLGLARSFSVDSMEGVNTPVLVLGAGVDIGDLPQKMESGYLAGHLSVTNRRYKVYQQAKHFSFMQVCKPQAIALLNAETPGDSIVCEDGTGASRLRLHSQMFQDIYRFIRNHQYR